MEKKEPKKLSDKKYIGICHACGKESENLTLIEGSGFICPSCYIKIYG